VTDWSATKYQHQKWRSDKYSIHVLMRPESRSILHTLRRVFSADTAKSYSEGVDLRSNTPTLVAALGALLVLIAAGSIDTLASLARIRRQESEIQSRFLVRSRALDEIRSAVYLSASDVVTPLPRQAVESLARLEPESASLRGELVNYWKLLDLMIEMQQRNASRGVDAYFTAQLTKRRETMLRIAREISSIMDRDIEARDRELAAMHTGFRSRAQLAMVLTVALGLLVGVATLRRVTRLESEAADRFAQIQALSLRVVKAQEEERRAVARELHDDIGQTLSALLVEAGNAAADSDSTSRLESIRTLAERAVTAVRNMALSLRPSMLDDFGLVAALDWLGREVSRRTGLHVRVSVDESAATLPDDIRTCIYRVAQEALHNCERHASAKQVQLTVSQRTDRVSLTIKDDGRGFDALRTRGLGLLGIKERVVHLGGVLSIDSLPGSGTLLSIELPRPV
jgi:signal transduction histidine kinase